VPLRRKQNHEIYIVQDWTVLRSFDKPQTTSGHEWNLQDMPYNNEFIWRASSSMPNPLNAL
jgi:hypothetical protein